MNDRLLKIIVGIYLGGYLALLSLDLSMFKNAELYFFWEKGLFILLFYYLYKINKQSTIKYVLKRTIFISLIRILWEVFQAIFEEQATTPFWIFCVWLIVLHQTFLVIKSINQWK